MHKVHYHRISTVPYIADQSRGCPVHHLGCNRSYCGKNTASVLLPHLLLAPYDLTQRNSIVNQLVSACHRLHRSLCCKVVLGNECWLSWVFIFLLTMLISTEKLVYSRSVLLYCFTADQLLISLFLLFSASLKLNLYILLVLNQLLIIYQMRIS